MAPRALEAASPAPAGEPRSSGPHQCCAGCSAVWGAALRTGFAVAAGHPCGRPSVFLFGGALWPTGTLAGALGIRRWDLRLHPVAQQGWAVQRGEEGRVAGPAEHPGPGVGLARASCRPSGKARTPAGRGPAHTWASCHLGDTAGRSPEQPCCSGGCGRPLPAPTTAGSRRLPEQLRTAAAHACAQRATWRRNAHPAQARGRLRARGVCAGPRRALPATRESPGRQPGSRAGPTVQGRARWLRARGGRDGRSNSVGQRDRGVLCSS